jgi:hypothetical protein
MSGAVLLFSQDKMSNNIETRSISKKTLFYKLVLGFKAKLKTPALVAQCVKGLLPW